MATDLRGLNNFKSKLQSYQKINSGIANEVLDEVIKRGEQIAQQEYAGITDVKIYHESIAGGSRVVAEKEGLAYIEFGTGRVGEKSQYPKDKLPKQTLTFESPQGKQHSTNGWEYYYPNQQTKRTVFGQEGWFHKFDDETDVTFVTGQPAQMQMYRTSQRLRQEMPGIIKNKIKGDGTNV